MLPRRRLQVVRRDKLLTLMALIKGPRAVALLDVLGFSNLIRQAGTGGLDSYLDRVVEVANLY